MKPALERAMRAAAQRLTAATHGHILEEVQKKLRSTRQKYVDALSFSQVNDNTWIISLAPQAFFIEEGLMSDFDLIPGLLGRGRPGLGASSGAPKGEVKTAKDGCVLNPRNKVLTSLGWKKIKDIAPGDLVLTHSGKFREVKQLLVTSAGIGTKYVCFYPKSNDKSTGTASKKTSDLVSPSISLTIDHPVLTPDGWKAASELKRGDLIATPADLKRRCSQCDAPLPINTPKITYCLNNSCARKAGVRAGRMLNFSPADRRRNGKNGNQKAKEIGIFDRPDWGARNPNILKKLRDGSSKAMRRLISSGFWAPEVAFEKNLEDAGVLFERERPILTDRIVNAGRGRTRKSTLFLDFYIPELRLAIELDGKKWHEDPQAQERDRAKDKACKRDQIRILRIPSHKIYRRGPRLAKHLNIWTKNHSGELGVAWVRIGKIKKGTVSRPDHVYAKKYDICLDAEEHSFCCETVFIHNSRYRSIPFQQNKPGSAQTPMQTSMTNQIKSEMKARQIPFGKIEKDSQGVAKTGLLHSFDVTARGKGASTPMGRYENSLVQGVRVYQRQIKDKAGKEVTKRDIMTFRTVSSKSHGWKHPGLEPRLFMDAAFEWAQREWSEKIAPDIIKQVVDGI